MNMLARPNYLFNLLSAEPAVKGFSTAFGPCWDMHTIAIANIGQADEFLPDLPALHLSNQFREGSSAKPFTLSLEHRMARSIPEKNIGLSYFGQRNSPWKEVEVYAGERFDASLSFLIQRGMSEASFNNFGTLLIPPFGAKPFHKANCFKSYPLQNNAEIVLGAIYSHWSDMPRSEPTEIVIGVRDDETYKAYEFALWKTAGGVMKSDPATVVKEFEEVFEKFLLDPRTPRVEGQFIKDIVHLPEGHPAHAMAFYAYERPYLFTIDKIAQLSALAVQDHELSAFRLSPSYEVLETLAAASLKTTSMIASYELSRLPYFEYKRFNP